jgi:hypothetical protein
MTSDADLAARALGMAQSDAEVERDEGVAWLLAHPQSSRPLLVDAVRSGSCGSPELCLRVLAALGGEDSVDAIEAALLRAHEGESFYAAVALADAGEPGVAVLRRRRDHPSEAVRRAVAHALSMQE